MRSRLREEGIEERRYGRVIYLCIKRVLAKTKKTKENSWRKEGGDGKNFEEVGRTSSARNLAFGGHRS